MISPSHLAKCLDLTASTADEIRKLFRNSSKKHHQLTAFELFGWGCFSRKTVTTYAMMTKPKIGDN